MRNALIIGLVKTARGTARGLLAVTLFFGAAWLADAIANGIKQGPY